jgi:Flp pilus assembly protein TadB|tara:strand:- start:396 stop:1016 length:621 start_codon:yes stop_codon:yes gene_type:complete
MHNSDKENQKTPPTSVNNEQNETLSALWQTQPVTAIDVDEVKSSLRSERTKQRWYMVFDSLMVIPAIYILNKYWGNMTLVAQMMFVFMLVTSVPLLIYQLWLRRVAAFYKDSQTANHLTRLTKQIKNNVKIAFITKHSTWVAVVFGIAFILERYFLGDLTPEKIIKMSIVMVLMTIGMLVWYMWADKRQKRFERQLKTLESMAQHC